LRTVVSLVDVKENVDYGRLVMSKDLQIAQQQGQESYMAHCTEKLRIRMYKSMQSVYGMYCG